MNERIQTKRTARHLDLSGPLPAQPGPGTSTGL